MCLTDGKHQKVNHLRKKAVFSWSGGKDSALALQKVLDENEFEVVSLFSTINETETHSEIHHIPIAFLEKQAESIGIPLYTMSVSKEKNYESGMMEAIKQFKKMGVSHFIFGDIFLEEVKSFRETKFNPLGIEIIEPLWGKSSEEICRDFLKFGIKSKVVVTLADTLDADFIGKTLDADFFASLPKNVDCCGENGEYHSFVYDAAFFKNPIEYSFSGVEKVFHDFKMDTSETKRFWYWRAVWK